MRLSRNKLGVRERAPEEEILVQINKIYLAYYFYLFYLNYITITIIIT